MAEALTDEFMQGIIDDYTASRRAAIVGLDEEFFISRTPLMLDPAGVGEALEAAAEYENAMMEIAGRSAERRATEPTEAVPVSSSVVFFKMPTPPEKKRSTQHRLA
jgi:hypothetical protein